MFWLTVNSSLSRYCDKPQASGLNDYILLQKLKEKSKLIRLVWERIRRANVLLELNISDFSSKTTKLKTDQRCSN
ncbi:hypothetical protein RRG08_049352 [Elysia crispata]|uniref:Uncharacterized protein n=1 Tax=Elysia crispata TaxID=231223 RepID=A0AAE0XE40_9GAST|nr:hypothetical protein RRG08_049352 [Elysia crispata]